MNTTILALESSCDDTSASIIKDGKILTNIISSQKIHTAYGGVVPEFASRQHQKSIITVVEKAFKESGVSKKDLDAIAFTQGPGLIGSLLVTTSFAKGLALAMKIPLIGVDHLLAHVMANFIDDPKPVFPYLCLLVSGGHTQILKVNNYLEFEIVGQTIDDAAGEALDKSAKIIDLPYPGGPAMEKYAVQGNIHAFDFPVPKIKGLDFSFSGLKTSFLYKVRDHLKNDPDFIGKNINDLCASFQHRVMSYLLDKLTLASDQFGINEIALAGGVAANKYLREKLNERATAKSWHVYIPDMEYCTDNAAMIAVAAHYKFENKQFDELDVVNYSR